MSSVEASQIPTEAKTVDQRVAIEAARGSLPAFTKLVRRWQGPIFNFHLRTCGCHNDAADLSQETFMRAWSAIGRYDSRWRFSTWIFTIARRVSVDHLRKRGRGHADDASRHARVERVASSADPPHEAVAREEAERLWRVAERVLTPQQRSALWLYYSADLPIADLGRVFGKSSVAMRVMLFRLRQKLAAELEREERGPREPAQELTRPVEPLTRPMSEALS
jgi:RNA polymerase sigma-70 factor (ECF subfamily)